ncbi:multidrug effflux MFS transporter [Thalassomonas viridans]|uniref:Bcr/CflA family efflux transporter n=1 Tax=Thalassomonas viridans TaxID=137584 RepID=A0AAE9YZK6_9GAMM|nr:multidrug effflux MFS transporter [Thalassomonas viridans]WDE03309.1 multidrug effflux MFS transporter [Thalassomonas viridans]
MKQETHTVKKEFIALMAILMSLVALTIDAMLPALSQIGTSLQVADSNDSQLIITSVFLGMAMGLIFYGPLSDAYGRKKIIYLGIGIFILGNLLSIFSNSFPVMLAGRVLQGFGVASCRVVSLAMIRDQFAGPQMGKVMSLIMMFFIMVPALAPSVGQGILLFSHWRAIFVLVLVFGLICFFWLHFRQAETLVPEKRIPLSLASLKAGAAETLKHPVSRSYMLASGITFGAFLGYLSSAQQILQHQYQLGELFSLYFGALALAIGLSSFANSRLVMHFDMAKLCHWALIVITVTALAFYCYVEVLAEQPSLTALMAYLAVTFFSVGILFGNLNTLALHPLGHIAGIATSVISSVQTFISVLIGGIIGQLYDASVVPLVLGFFFCSLSTLILIYRTRKTSAI